MKHIQIMNNLHTLDLSGASFCLIDEYQESFVINPYRNILINKNLEEVILPKELAVNNVDLSYCLALKKIVVSGENVVFRGYDAEGMKYCSNIRTIEYKEGVEACNNHFEWEEDINMIETIIFPSTLKYIPNTITFSNNESGKVDGYKYAQICTTVCEKLICKALVPPVYDTNTGNSYLKDYYDPINKSYYRKSTFGGENVNTITKVVVTEDAVLYVPRESIELYRIAPLWENFTNIKAIEDME